MLQGSVVVVVVVGHGPQSCGHVEQSSEGPHNPSPHTQLQGGDPPVQLQRPALQSAINCRRQAPPCLPAETACGDLIAAGPITARRESSSYRRRYADTERQHRKPNEHLASGHGPTPYIW